MLVNPYNTVLGKLKSYLERKHPTLLESYILPTGIVLFDRLFKSLSKKQAKNYLSSQPFPVFQTIEIETINRCNGSCTFCPINHHIDPRPYKKMDEDLFKSIINQLVELNYKGSIGLYSNNEPLLDKRLLEFLKFTREKLPNATLYLFTNGTLLTLDYFKKLMLYLDWMTIDNYSDTFELHEGVRQVYDYIKTQSYQDKVHIYYRKENEILLNRGGEAKNRTTKKNTLKSACMYPFEQVVVRPDGKLSLCCNDATGSVTMGDLCEHRLIDIWYGKVYDTVRQNMLTDRNKNKLCHACDVVTPKIPAGTAFKFKNIVSWLKGDA
ncbi:SPASM domain-containing protein [Vallitalea pronyensis]|uniref:SPASM domain-containing protein n=1 Tax=Vallitalea pronyensis TaxID=1348613 RepID=A0A8J8MMA7_9FIRM|nr:radical SAM/SPASM domain-containing protein [Vallitalea pronyensis]QUI24151.1 SPASM domain-containing protein [Vallitalea pronyensis]